jgi:hypothetical protein
MRKILFGLLALTVVSSIWAFPKIQALNNIFHLFDEDRIVENFRSSNTLYPTRLLVKSTQPYSYSEGPRLALPTSFNSEDESFDTEKFLEDSWTTGLVIIQDDQIVSEKYYRGNTANTQNISWSMSKSFISALVGIAVDEGHIGSIDEAVEVYAPQLIGSGYEGVSIKDVLQMSTGIEFNEDYGDFFSDINRWGRDFALGNSQDEFAASLEREIEPGTVNHYVSINTHVLGMIITHATGQTITDYMQEKLYEPLGMESPGSWVIDGDGMEMALGGLNLTLRDFAKIGSLYLNDGQWNNHQIIPKDWVEASINPDAPHLLPNNSLGYGYQWWIPPGNSGEFMAMGVYGQFVYINPLTQTVVAKLSANPRYNDKSYAPSRGSVNIDMFRAIADAAVAQSVDFPDQK